MKLHIDIETRSTVDLRKTGQYVYAESTTTEITTVAWSIDDDPVRVWLPPTSTWSAEALVGLLLEISPGPASTIHPHNPAVTNGWLDVGEMPDMLAMALADPAVQKMAHNASFERILLSSPAGRRIGFPASIGDVKQWDCTAARAACFGLPRTLDGAGAALGLATRKDSDGHKLMLQMCKPRRPRKGEPDGVYWYDDADRVIRQAAYCKRDVEAEQAIDKVLPSLSPEERECWEITERMNDYGVLVDETLLVRVTALIEQAEERLNASLAAKTAGGVKAVSDTGALKRWLVGQGVEEAEDGIDKAAVAAMIENPDVPALVREVLQVRRDGGGSSAKKWKAILGRLSADGRARGGLVYCGAAATRRWSSRGIQLQNLPARVTIVGGDVDAAVRDLLDGATIDEIEDLYGPPLLVASALLRPAFKAPGNAVLARGDLSQIEARVNPWLAQAEWVLDAFRAYDAGTGPDLYKVTAAGMYHCAPGDVSKEQRQAGKVAALALGFGGGARALQAMAKAYSMHIPEWPRDEKGWPLPNPADGTDEWMKRQWRAANPEICGLWRGLEASAMECMGRPPGETVEVWTLDKDNDPMAKTRLAFRRNDKVLVMLLPSGRGISYWTPRLRRKTTPLGERWSLSYRAENPVTTRWDEFDAYGGILCQNAVQATARDVMRDALRRFADFDVLPVLTVHDEGIGEAFGPDAAERVHKAMTTPPAWAVGLPIAADSSAGPRYVKG